MIKMFKNFFDLINSLIEAMFGITDDLTFTAAVSAAQLRHEATSGMTEGVAIVQTRQAKRMLELSPPSEPA